MIEKIAQIIHDDISLTETPVNDADRKLAEKILSLFSIEDSEIFKETVAHNQRLIVENDKLKKFQIEVDCPDENSQCPTGCTGKYDCKNTGVITKFPDSGDYGRIL